MTRVGSHPLVRGLASAVLALVGIASLGCVDEAREREQQRLEAAKQREAQAREAEQAALEQREAQAREAEKALEHQRVLEAQKAEKAEN